MNIIQLDIATNHIITITIKTDNNIIIHDIVYVWKLLLIYTFINQ